MWLPGSACAGWHGPSTRPVIALASAHQTGRHLPMPLDREGGRAHCAGSSPRIIELPSESLRPAANATPASSRTGFSPDLPHDPLDTKRHPPSSAAPGLGQRIGRAGRIAPCLLWVLGLGACVHGVVPETPELTLPPAYDAAAQENLPPAELDRWWLLYSDAQLTALIERAQAHGFDTRTALAKLQEAQAVRASALPFFIPDHPVEAKAEVRESKELQNNDDGAFVPVGGDTTVVGADRTRSASITFPVSWELDLFGRRAAVRRASDGDLLAARFEFEGARATLVADVARNLFQARGLAVQLDDARANARIQRELVDLLSRRVERGLAAASEADRVGADLAQADAQALDLEAELKATRRALLVLLGDGYDPVSELEVNPDIGTVPAIPSTLPGDLLARRPDVRQADARVRAAAGNVKLAERALFPRLTLTPSVGISAQRGAFDSTTQFWTLGLGFSLPVLDRPRLTQQLNAESARGQQSLIAYERSVQTAFSEADQALTRLAADRLRVQTLEDGEARGRRAYDAALRRFKLGFSDLQVVLDAERTWRTTRTALTGARIDALLRSVQAFQALGGGWPASQTPLPDSPS